MNGIDVTGQEILTELVMCRSQGAALALVVEGPEDHYLFNSRVDHDVLSLTVAHGKPACLDAAKAAEEQGLAWVRVLVDRDFDYELSEKPRRPQTLVATQSYDMQVDYVRAQRSILRDVILGHLDGKMTRAFLKEFPNGPEPLIVACVALIGKLRLAIVRKEARISVRKLSLQGLPQALLAGEEMEWLVGALGSRVRGGRGKEALRVSDVEDLLGDVGIPGDEWDVACGHDLVEVVAQMIAAFSGRPPNRDTLEHELRARVSNEVFFSLPAVREVSEWGCAQGRRLWMDAA